MARKKSLLYESGLPFNVELAKSLDDCAKRVENNFASMIIIDGAIGQGKTTLAVHIADYINGSPINLKDQLGMGGEDFAQKLQIAHEKGLKVVIDRKSVV